MFTPEMLDFLVANRLEDSKEWFDAHRPEYERLVREPFFAFIDEVAARLRAEVEPELMDDHKRALSRVRRDTRFTNDKTRYRDSVWCSFGRDKRYYPEFPAFFFEVRPEYAWWGCGMYFATKEMRDSYWRMILARSPLFLDAKRDCEAAPQFAFDADGAFKRTKFPDEPADVRPWLDRHSIYLAHTVSTEEAFAPDIAARVSEEYRSLYSFYRFLAVACEAKFAG